MANAAQLKSDSSVREKATPAWAISAIHQECATPATWRDAASMIDLVDNRASSAELLHRLSELVDNIGRISCASDHLPIHTRQPHDRASLDCKGELVPVGGMHRAIPFRLLPIAKNTQ